MQYHHLQLFKNKYCAQTISTTWKHNQISGEKNLLGVIITDDLKWKENTALICNKVNKKFFWLSKLKGFGVPPEGLITAWKVLIRPITEYAAPLWHSGLSIADTKKLESLQKKIIGLAYGIIFKDYRIHYNINGTAMTYDQAVVELGLPKLAERRESKTITFGVDTFNNERHNGFFEEKIHVTPNTSIWEKRIILH